MMEHDSGSSVVVHICNALVPDVLLKAELRDPTAVLDFSHVERLAKAVGIPQVCTLCGWRFERKEAALLCTPLLITLVVL